MPFEPHCNVLRNSGRRTSFAHTLFGLSILACGSLAAAAPDTAPVSVFKSKSVNWTAESPTVQKAKRGGRVSLVLRGTPVNGWHIYGFNQHANGPIPLRAALDPTDLASVGGQVAASAPIKKFEPAFGVETPYYQRDFTVTIPVQLKANAPVGRQLIPVSVRFQACSNGTCEPPKTIHLSAPVQIVA